MARILVIDDEPVMQRLVARALPEDDVVVRGDARDALAMLVRGEKFDLILTDLNMPGMGGREFHQAVAVMQPATAALIVFMTGGAVAESDEEFTNWLNAMRQPGRDPQDPTAGKGRDVFMQARCAGCHAVRGSDAAGGIAPDLTHVASRRTLGAGSMANTPDNLANWIRDSQHVKPGNQMPANPLAGFPGTTYGRR